MKLKHVYIRLGALDRGRPRVATLPLVIGGTGEAVATTTTGSVITEGVTGTGAVDATTVGVRRKTRAGLGV